MRAGIESRLEKLERQMGVKDADRLTVILMSFVDAVDGNATDRAPLAGYTYAPHGGARVEFLREAGESDDDILRRAKGVVAPTMPENGVMVFHEIRGL